MNKIKDNISLIFTIIVICIVFWFGRSCGKAISPKTNLEPVTDTFISHKVDTVWAKDTVLKYTLKLKYKHDTIIKPIYLDSTECNRINVYDDTIDTQDYTLFTKKHIQGRLRYDTVGVKLKVPLEIIKSTTLTVKHDTIISPKHEIKIGVLSGFKTLAPMIEYRNKRITYGLAYDPFQKTPYIKLSYTVFRSK